jgi:hypothetical protein
MQHSQSPNTAWDGAVMGLIIHTKQLLSMFTCVLKEFELGPIRSWGGKAPIISRKP